jgi:hypothetical protein
LLADEYCDARSPVSPRKSGKDFGRKMSDNVVKFRPFISPKDLFEQLQERESEMHAVAVTILWKDGKTSSGWSNCMTSELCLMEKRLGVSINQSLVE